MVVGRVGGIGAKGAPAPVGRACTCSMSTLNCFNSYTKAKSWPILNIHDSMNKYQNQRIKTKAVSSL